MSTRKVADLTVKVGEYEKNGEKKGEYQNIGQVLVGDDGREMILVESWALSPSLPFLANRDRRRRVLLGRFEAQDAQQSKPPARTGPQSLAGDTEDIPF